jgi:hypothetical protein
MLFSPKAKGFFVDHNENGVFVARTSAPKPPFTVEEMREVAKDNAAGLAEVLKQLQPKRPRSGYVHATVGMHSEKRFVRRATVDLKRVKEVGYLDEVLQTQFRIEPEKFTAAALRPNDGGEYDAPNATTKDVVLCGIPSDDIVAFQESLLAQGIFPDRLEMTSVSCLGALADYISFTRSKVPTLVLELGFDSTHSFILSPSGIEASRPFPIGLSSMIPVVQKELGLKDEDSAKRLFFSNTFDFTGMGAQLIQRLIRELQSSIGFYEVQTGLTIGQMVCIQFPPKLAWIADVVANELGIKMLQPDMVTWLSAREVTLSDSVHAHAADPRWLGVLSLMVNYDANASQTKA